MLQDTRYALRRITRTPAFSISVILILAIGIGAATTMTSVLYALAYRPLGLPNPESLVAITTVDQRGNGRITPLPTIEQLRSGGLVADGWCAHNAIVESFTANNRMHHGWTDLMTGDCLRVLGVEPAMGRWFSDDEMPLTGKGPPVVILSDRFWRRMFDGAPDVLGRTVQIQNVSATVIGVMPPEFVSFDTDHAVDLIAPFNAHRQASGGLRFMGRLKPDATIEQLQAHVVSIWPSVLEAVLPAGPAREQSLKEWTGDAQLATQGFSVLRRLYTAPVERFVVLTLALMALVCVNVGALMISRFTGRAQEIGAMRALGANALRLVRPMAIEGLLLAVGGTVVGVPLAYLASRSFAALFPTGNTPWDLATTPDGMVLAAVAGAVFVVAGTISAVPIWLAVRKSPGMQQQRTASRATNRWTQAMLVSQIAVTIALVFTCGLVMRSFYGLITVDRGYDRNHLLSLRLGAVPGGYLGMDASSYYPSLVQRLTDLPGVERVGLARYFGTISAQMPEQPVGFVEVPDNIASAAMDFVSPGFFAAIDAPLLAGRDLAWSDLPSTTRVALVSESVARQLAPDADVVGRTIRYGTTAPYSRLQIVGVVGNISIGNVRKTEERMIYTSAVQVGETVSATAHLRTSGPPLQFAAAASQAIAALGREHATGAYSDMLFGNSIVAERMGAAVSAVVALLAMIISCIGVFALLSNAVQRRTREIGIRVAVGATPRAISTLIVRDAAILIACGLVVGIPGALAATALVRSLLFGVSATDGVTLMASVTLLATTGLLAAVLPTRQALRVDPSEALRAE